VRPASLGYIKQRSLKLQTTKTKTGRIYTFACSRCGNERKVFSNTRKNARTLCRDKGWVGSNDNTWYCLHCWVVRKMLTTKRHGLFMMDGKEYLKSTDGNVYEVARL
jgi:hypothetical protein